MIMFHLMLLLFSILAWMNTVECLEVIPERAEIAYVNPKYVYPNVTLNVRRYSRRSRYITNQMFTTKHTWANNITAVLSVSQLLHNEYRPSFVKITEKLCDLVNKEFFAGGTIKNAGLVCPSPPGYHSIANFTSPTEHFPNVFPFEKGRCEVELRITDTKESVIGFGVVASFKQKP